MNRFSSVCASFLNDPCKQLPELDRGATGADKRWHPNATSNFLVDYFLIALPTSLLNTQPAVTKGKVRKQKTEAFAITEPSRARTIEPPPPPTTHILTCNTLTTLFAPRGLRDLKNPFGLQIIKILIFFFLRSGSLILPLDKSLIKLLFYRAMFMTSLSDIQPVHSKKYFQTKLIFVAF